MNILDKKDKIKKIIINRRRIETKVQYLIQKMYKGSRKSVKGFIWFEDYIRCDENSLCLIHETSVLSHILFVLGG